MLKGKGLSLSSKLTNTAPQNRVQGSGFRVLDLDHQTHEKHEKYRQANYIGNSVHDVVSYKGLELGSYTSLLALAPQTSI